MSRLTQQIEESMNRQQMNAAMLAIKAGLSRDAVYKILHGRRVPSLPTLQKLSDALDLPLKRLTDLLLDEEPVAEQYSAGLVCEPVAEYHTGQQTMKVSFEGELVVKANASLQNLFESIVEAHIRFKR